MLGDDGVVSSFFSLDVLRIKEYIKAPPLCGCGGNTVHSVVLYVLYEYHTVDSVGSFHDCVRMRLHICTQE